MQVQKATSQTGTVRITPTNSDELFTRLVLDPLFFLMGFCSVPDYGTTRGLVPFRANGAQLRYLREIWAPHTPKDIVAKSRKHGFSYWRIGLGMHLAMYTPHWIFRIVSHREKTTNYLHEAAMTLHRTAVKELRRALPRGVDPHEFIPRITNGNGEGCASAIEFGDVGSAIVFDTAGGKGVGQADRSDDLYLTEYSEWERAERTFKQLSGSQPKGSRHTKLTIDFNAEGTTNDAYDKYTRGKLAHTDPQWNGFVSFFAGVADVPECYPPDVMELELRSLGARRFAEVYPSNDSEMWQSSQTSVWLRELVQAAFDASGGTYASGGAGEYFHGVDTATGRPNGDYQTHVTFKRAGGGLVEAAPPLRMRVPEDVFAVMVDKRSREFPGVVVVERNVGSAVIGRLRDLGTPGLYRHAHREKDSTNYEIGFPTTYGSKRMMIADTERMLRAGELVIVSESVRQEMTNFEWKVRDTGAEDKTTVAGAPDREDSHDDLVMAVMLAIQGMLMPTPQVWNPDELLREAVA